MYQIKKNTELNLIDLGKILLSFQTKEQVQLQKYHDYYNGKMAILNRQPSDAGRYVNNTVVNFCKIVTDSYCGYMSDVEYNNISDDLYEILKYNDYKAEDNDFLQDALIYGKAFEIVYRDLDGKERFKLLDPRTCIDIYDDTLDQELQYVVRFWQTDLIEENQPVYTVEVYGKRDCKVYQSGPGFASFMLMEERPNYYSQVPLTVFTLNKQSKSIFDQAMGLNDDYNILISDSTTEFQSFADAYLILKGQMADEEQLNSMKKHRCLMLDKDSDAQFLYKDIKNSAIDSLLDNVEDKIYRVTGAVNFSDPELQVNSGIALKLRLISMEDIASSIEYQMKKALQKRLEILCSVLSLLNGEEQWVNAELIFTRNIPTNLETMVDIVTSLQNIVSRETLLSQLPFVTNVDEEMQRLEAERQSYSDYLRLDHNEQEED